jgi:cyclic GMP-AMP synthase DncV-like protein
MTSTSRGNIWAELSDALDIPQTYYEAAAQRHQSLGGWLCRPQSRFAAFGPDVRPQGSFRYGTVIRPIVEGTEYDLDHVVVLHRLSTGTMSQEELKTLFGQEIVDYAVAHQMRPPIEKNRCWQLKYRDEVPFHLDSLPCVPAGREAYDAFMRAGVDPQFAERAVAITDRRHPSYALVNPGWLTSNPRGFARWFESRAAMGRAPLTQNRFQASVQDVPPYGWKTPLQRSIQILKRHRDVMFRADPTLAPISMILTNLAAQAYGGEKELSQALLGILARMQSFVKPAAPRVPNPTHPQEDYADKWRVHPHLEKNFCLWLEQARRDVAQFSDSLARIDGRLLHRVFAIPLTERMERVLAVGAPAVVLAAGREPSPLTTRIVDPPKPWGGTER